jgi:hypothetical protein
MHHISYEVDVLYGKNLERLASLCESCHERIEFDEDGKKISDLSVKKEPDESLLAKRGSEEQQG